MTHCKNGHKFTDDNTYVYFDRSGSKHRRCRRCAHDRHKSWSERNPEYYRLKEQRRNHKARSAARRAKLRGQFVEDVDKRILLRAHGFKCGICLQDIEGEYVVDHVYPLDAGGEHSYANTQPAHPTCNDAKSWLIRDVEGHVPFEQQRLRARVISETL